MNSQIAIIGAGGWGTAIAITMAQTDAKDREIRLWAFEPYLVETMIATRENPIYLAGVSIPETVSVSNSMKDVLAGAAIVIIAVPSHGDPRPGPDLSCNDGPSSRRTQHSFDGG